MQAYDGCGLALRWVRLLAVVLVTMAAAAAFAAEIVLQPRQVGSNTWAVIGDSGPASAANRAFNSNAGFVVTSEGVVVFDALGTPALGEALIAAIRRVTSQPIRRLIISHYHADHYYGMQAFKAVGAEVWAHQAARGVIGSEEFLARLEQRRRDLFPWVDENTKPSDADRWLSFDGTGEIRFVMGGQTFRLIDVGGAHSPHDLMMKVEGDSVLFAGDVYFTGRVPFVVGADTRRWLEVLDRIVKLRPRVAVPGHGGVSQRIDDDLALTRNYLRHVREVMEQAVATMTDFDEAFDQADWSRWANLPAFFPAHRLNARSIFLEMERESLAR
jgi:glyoxylase-like metal-dependent hydrolase (beta-lactamase superfamily II)